MLLGDGVSAGKTNLFGLSNVLGFYMNLPIGAIAALFLLRAKVPGHVEETDKTEKSLLKIFARLDPIGFTLFAAFVIMFLLALEWGGSKYLWKSSTIIGLFCGAIGTLITFAIWEQHVGDEAMIPFSVLLKKVVWCSCMVMWLFFGSIMIFSYYLPIYFQAVKGVSPTLSGVYLLPSILSTMIMAVISGILGRKYSFLQS